MATAGRTVFFSSLTVAAALASLLVFPQRFLYSMGLGGVAGGAARGAVALTVLPAVLTLLGTRVNSGSAALPAAPRRARRPARRERLLVPALALRDAPAGPGRDGQRAAADRRSACPSSGSSSPPSTRPCCRARQRPPGLRHRRADFPPRDTPIRSSSKAAARGRRRRSPPRSAGSPASPRSARRSALRGGVTAIEAISATRSSPSASQDTVKRIRACPPPGATVLVGGATADFIDFQSEPRQPPADRPGDHHRGDPGDPLPDDRLGGPAGQVAADERAQPQRRLRPAGPDLPGRPARGLPRLHRARGRSSRRCRS